MTAGPKLIRKYALSVSGLIGDFLLLDLYFKNAAMCKMNCQLIRWDVSFYTQARQKQPQDSFAVSVGNTIVCWGSLSGWCDGFSRVDVSKMSLRVALTHSNVQQYDNIVLKNTSGEQEPLMILWFQGVVSLDLGSAQLVWSLSIALTLRARAVD